MKRTKPYAPILSVIAASTTEPPVGASTCASGSQVCTGHIGTLTENARKNATNSSSCDLHRQRHVVPIDDGEALRDVVEVDQRHQHQQRAQQRVQEELDRGVHPVRSAPDADDDVHRDQHRLEEHVEQDAVDRREHAVDEAGHDQERGHVLRDPRLDHLPARPDDEHRGEAVQQHEQHRDAVDAEEIVDVEARESTRGARRTAGPTSPASKCSQSGSVTRKPTTAPTSAIQRAAPASRSRPTASTPRPATIGTQMASDR